jgi:rSAM/selenodomain-associated transferase 2
MVPLDSMIEATGADARIAVVVPVLRDALGLERLAADIAAQSRRPNEIVVVSGARDEDVDACAERHGFRLIDSTASRGLQLDTGAAATNADIFWFVHADARLPRGACQAVIEAVGNGAAGGCLQFTFAGPRSLRKRVLEWLIRARVACGGIAYGDQALFCTREAYAASGGFPHQALFEEVPVVRYLQRQRSFVVLDTSVMVSCRRWERDGWLRRTLHNRWLALRHGLGTSPESLARAYRGSSQNQATPAAEPGTPEPRG